MNWRSIWFWLRFREADGLPLAAKINVQPCGGAVAGDVLTGVQDEPHAAFGYQGTAEPGNSTPDALTPMPLSYAAGRLNTNISGGPS